MAYELKFKITYLNGLRCFPNFGAVRTINLICDVHTNDRYHGLLVSERVHIYRDIGQIIEFLKVRYWFQMVKFFTFWFTGCCIYMLGMTSVSESQRHNQLPGSQTDAAPPRMLYSDAGYEIDVEKTGLRKRAISRAAKGMAALEKLLTGATKVHTSSKNFRLYKKNGNRQTALEDFYSVDPMLTKRNQRPKIHLRYSRTEVLVGTVGDRRLILMPNGDRYSRQSSVLEIRSASDAYYDRIVYKTTGN